MKTLRLGAAGPVVPAIGLGMMRLPTCKSPDAFLRAAMDAGFRFFDHADIYGRGESETIFARCMADVPRDRYVLQSKCGIRKTEGGSYYDLSARHILSSVEGILSRLKTDYLDVLLLHRPDALMEPEEVAEAFDRLRAEGKVLQFGVSNMSPGQMELLGSALKEPLVVDQMQLSLPTCPMVDFGLRVNTMEDGAIPRDGSVLDWCRLHGVTLQAWSPYSTAGSRVASWVRPSSPPSTPNWIGWPRSMASRPQRWPWPGFCAIRRASSPLSAPLTPPVFPL